jgi:hypothetical protein
MRRVRTRVAWAEQLIVCIRLEEEEDICLVAQQAIAGAAQFLADVLGFSLFPRVDAHFSFASLAEEIRMFTVSNREGGSGLDKGEGIGQANGRTEHTCYASHTRSLRQRRLHAWELVEEAQPQLPQHATPVSMM